MADKTYTRGRVTELVILSGSNLAAKDLGGTSDPYCLVKTFYVQSNYRYVTAEETLHKTATIKKTLDPTWNEAVKPFDVGTFSWGPVGKYKDVLRIEVWDWDAIGSDDFMGVAEVVLQDVATSSDPVELELALTTREGKPKEKVSGSIKIRLAFTNNEIEIERKAKEEEEEERARQEAEQEAKARAAAEQEAKKKAERDEWENLVKSLTAKADPEAVIELVKLIKEKRNKWGDTPEYHAAKQFLFIAVPKLFNEVPAETYAQTLEMMYESAMYKIPTWRKAHKHPLETDDKSRNLMMALLDLAFDNPRAQFYFEEVICKWASNNSELWYPSTAPGSTFRSRGHIDQWIEELHKDVVSLQQKEASELRPFAAFGVGLVLEVVLACTLWNLHNSNERYHDVMANALFKFLMTLQKGLGEHDHIRGIMRAHKDELVKMYSRVHISGRLLATAGQRQEFGDLFKPLRVGYLQAGIWSTPE